LQIFTLTALLKGCYNKSLTERRALKGELLMNGTYTYIPDLSGLVDIPVDGILSRTIHNDEHVKAVLFGFGAGQELSAHTAPTAAVLHILRGEALLTLGESRIDAKAGAWVYMPPQLEHGIYAKTPMVMILLLLKMAKSAI